MKVDKLQVVDNQQHSGEIQDPATLRRDSPQCSQPRVEIGKTSLVLYFVGFVFLFHLSCKEDIWWISKVLERNTNSGDSYEAEYMSQMRREQQNAIF